MLRGTITSIVADNSIGVRGEDGRSFWARLPQEQIAALRVGQRVQLAGQWQQDSFVVRNVRSE